MNDHTSIKPHLIQSVTRSLTIIELLGYNSEGLGLVEIARTVGLHKSTVYHLMATLVSQGFVRQNPQNRKYMIGPKLLTIAHLVLSNMDIRKQSESILNALAKRSGEVVHLVVLDQGQALYLHKIENPNVSHGLKMASYVGMKNDAHSSAVGKVLLAALDEKQLATVLKTRGMARHSDKTITSPAKLRQHLLEVRKNGFAIDDEENELGVRCVAAPVRDAQGNVVAAISISSPSIRVTREMIENKMIPLVKEAADDISQELGYTK